MQEGLSFLEEYDQEQAQLSQLQLESPGPSIEAQVPSVSEEFAAPESPTTPTASSISSLDQHQDLEPMEEGAHEAEQDPGPGKPVEPGQWTDEELLDILKVSYLKILSFHSYLTNSQF